MARAAYVWVLLASAACTGSGGDDPPGGEGAGSDAAGHGGDGLTGGNAGGRAGDGGGSTATSGRGGESGASAAGGAGGSSQTGAGGNAHGGGTGGVSGETDGGSANGGSSSGAGMSDLPVPPGPSDAGAPNGSGGPNLRVLPWAGFRGAASYTFDDSQPSHVAHFDEIAATGVPVTWYLNNTNNWIADYDATWMEALALGHELGNHTVHHCNFDLSGCSGALSSVDAEIDECSAYIEDTLGGPPVLSMAYPFGDTGWAQAARDRFPLARGIGDGLVAPDDGADPFDLPVKAAAGGEDAAAFESSIDAAQTQSSWVIFLFHSLLPTDQNWYAGVEIGSVTDSIEHAKALGDVWIDGVARIGSYWLGALQVSAASAEPVGGGMSGMTWSWELPEHFPNGVFVRVVIDGGELRQDGELLPWDGHGYYEVALDAGELAWSP